MRGNKSDDFVRDIESYFLNLKGKGIMLSPKEYDIIVNWQSRSVPKDLVMRGIRMAFEKDLGDEYERKKNFRSLTQCASYVEDLIKKYKTIQEMGVTDAGHSNKDLVNSIVDKLNKIIVSEKRDVVRKHYIKSRKRVLDLLKEDQSYIFRALREIEEDFFEDFFQSIPGGVREKIMQEAEASISERERFMTKRARLESLISFRNELLIKEFKLINFNTMDY